MASLNMTNTVQQQQQQQPITYEDVFNELHTHTGTMWTLLSIRFLISIFGFLSNMVIMLATMKERKLRSICNWLIALDSTFIGLFHLNAVVTFMVAATGIYLIPLSTCFYLQAIPLFGIIIAFQIMLLIGLERLVTILFPFWSRNFRSQYVHITLLLLTLVGCTFLVFLSYQDCVDVQTPVFCQMTDVTNQKRLYAVSSVRSNILHVSNAVVYLILWLLFKFRNVQVIENVSKNIMTSLFVLMLVEIFGWFPGVGYSRVLPLLNIDPLQKAYYSAGMSILSAVSGSANGPVLYIFSQSYRNAVKNLFVSKKVGGVTGPKNAWTSAAGVRAAVTAITAAQHQQRQTCF